MHLHDISQQWILYPPELGALTQLWAATSSEANDLNGKVRIVMT